MNIQKIAFKKLSSLVIGSVKNLNESQKTQFMVECLNIGYALDKSVLDYIPTSEYKNICQILAESVGADRTWKPMYKGFPNEVWEMSETELYLNAIFHYASFGTWLPESKELPKLPKDFENINYKIVKGVSQEQFMGIFTSILSTNASTTETDKQIIDWYFDNWDEKTLKKFLPKEISFKETLAQFVGACAKKEFTKLAKFGCKTTTDVLRVAAYFSGGDVSLATNTKFKLSNVEKRLIVSILESVISEEDVARHQETWKRLFFVISKYIKKGSKLHDVAKKCYDKNCKTFASTVETVLTDSKAGVDILKLLNLLKSRPGEFARRLDKILRENVDFAESIAENFISVADKIDVRVLYQLWSHFKYRGSDVPRVVIPVKGRAWNLKKIDKTISKFVIDMLVENIQVVIQNKFKKDESLGLVYIDEDLKKCPIPMAMRNTSDGLLQLAKGTRLKFNPLGKNVLRFFVHWFGNDVDLSAVFLDENLNIHSHISYTNVKQEGSGVYSGDITYAPRPNGACEFIDIDLTNVSKTARYVALQVYLFSGECEETKVGWMMRDTLGKRGDIFDAKTVENLVEFKAKRSATIALFDLKTHEVIWLDLEGNFSGWSNNVENTKATIYENAKSAIALQKATLYDLFYDHAMGNVTSVREDADTVFDIDMVYKYTEVLSKYL
jgi:hypothetical protein